MRPKILLSTGGGDASSYLAALEAAGGTGEARYLPVADLSYDGLLLTGGGDPHPSLFGQENRGSREIDRARDRAELDLLDGFLGAGKPVLAICRGHQMVNIYLGGTLIQDLPPGPAERHQAPDRDLLHQVRAETGSLLRRLYGSAFLVNSNHHQALGELGRGLRGTAWSEDGVVEAAEHETLPLISVQFHPERLTRPGGLDGGAIFRAFLGLFC